MAGLSAVNQTLGLLIFKEAALYWGGEQSRDTYLSRPHTFNYRSPSYGAHLFLKRGLEMKIYSPAKIYHLGETRTFHSPLPALSDSRYQVPLYAREGKTPPELTTALKRKGVCYILSNPGMGEDQLPSAYQTPAWRAFLAQWLDTLGPPLYSDSFAQLYALPGCIDKKEIQ